MKKMVLRRAKVNQAMAINLLINIFVFELKPGLHAVVATASKRLPGSAEGAGEESRASLHWSRKYNLKARKLTSTPRTKISIKWRRYGVCGFQSPQTQ